MSNISPLLLLTLGELLLVTSILSLVMVTLAVTKKRRDRVSARKLIDRIRQDESRRQSETRDLMGRNFGLQGELLNALVKKISREEKFFYQTLINLYLKRDSGALEVLHVAFEGATEPYRTLQLPSTETQTDQQAEAGATEVSAEIVRLQEENARLSEELRITMDTMGRMLSEYSSMYSGGAATDLDKERLLNMFRAEAGGKANEEVNGEAQTVDAAAEATAQQDTADEAMVEPELPASGDTDQQETPLVKADAADDFENDLLSLDDNQMEPQADLSQPAETKVS